MLRHLYFGRHLGNTIPALFWCLLCILHDEKAMRTIQEDIDKHLPSFSLENDDESGQLLQKWTPERLNSCVYLDSAVNEMLRLTATPMVLRKCCQTTQILLRDGRTINVKEDDTIALFPAASHYDDNNFSSPTKFVFDRFIHKSMDMINGFLPFGAVKSRCPGRFFAKYEIKICIAMFLRYIEYKLIDPETIPMQATHHVGIGIAPSAHDLPILYQYKKF